MTTSHKRLGNPVRQIVVQRRNFIAVCRLAVKTLIERACFDSIEDAKDELHNFLVIMEHILSHRLKPHQTWYGTEESRTFWDYIKVVCRDVPHNCIPSLENIEKPKTPQGKGRAWLRMALMEKRLHDYITHALQQVKITRSFYYDGALLLSEDSNLLSGIILGLNAIDFSFDVKGDNLDHPCKPEIDFTPYLKFDQILDFLGDEHMYKELREFGRLTSLSVDSDVFIDENSDTWRGRYYKVDARFRVVSEQKGYLEELVRLRENQLEEQQKTRNKLIETLQHYDSESRRERQQLEAIIIELQAQLGNTKEEQRQKLQQMQMLLHRYSTDMPTYSSPPDVEFRGPSSYPLVPNFIRRHLHSQPHTYSTATAQPPPLADPHDPDAMLPPLGSQASTLSHREARLQAVAHTLDSSGDYSDPGADNDSNEDHTSNGDKSDHIRRLSNSPFASPIIRQGHVNEDLDPDDSDSSENQKGESVRIAKLKSKKKQEDEMSIHSDKDAPKPDLVTSCDSTFESSENESMGKQCSTDDVENIPEEIVAVKSDLPVTQEEGDFSEN